MPDPSTELRQQLDVYLADCFARETVPHVSELARQLSMEPWELTRKFTNAAGIAPSSYLKQAQVARAATLLATTSLPTASVAYQSGFVSRRTMFRAFRRLTGSTPREYIELQETPLLN